MERINYYKHKAEILRQIHSNKSNRLDTINNIQSIVTVLVSSFITFIGFYGMDKLQMLLNKFMIMDLSILEFIFNTFVFILFINVILHLVFQFSKKQANADRAIVLLTSFINETSDLIESIRKGSNLITENTIDTIRVKYLTITSVIPANSDKEFLEAKKDFNEKESIKNEIQKPNIQIFNEKFLEDYTSKLIKSSSLCTFLRELRNLNSELYLGGGAIRNLVWDELHGYKMFSQISDLDIIYFDTLNNKKEHDHRIEEQLHKKIPNIKWSVKNQARMHIWNEEAPYSSLEDAISKWPETCTAIAVKMNVNDELEFLKPFGFSDLYRLIVIPTPHFKTKIERYRERIKSKSWITSWPKLKIID